jgi:hypothetical protein
MKQNEDREEFEFPATGRGPGSAGQSGDLQGIDAGDTAHLLEEGQSFEASLIEGIEDAASADNGPLKPREVPEDDVPAEYLDDETGVRP